MRTSSHRGALPPIRFLGVVFIALAFVAACDGGDAGESTQDTTPQDTSTASDTSAVDTSSTQDSSSDADNETASDVEEREGAGPPYPIILVHGMGGFEHLGSGEAVPYWWGVAERLESVGETVHVTETDPLNTSAFRGADVAEQIEVYLDENGYKKAVLIGHSQGGLDARWIAHNHPELVSAVVTIATPHHGTPISDVVLGLVEDERVHDLADAIVNVFGAPLYDELGNESALMKPVRLFSTPEIEKFNAEITDHPAVEYYSIAGRSDGAVSDGECYVPNGPEFIDRYWDDRDTLEPLLVVPEAVIDAVAPEPTTNDGLVRVDDAKWGTFLGCVPADHMDEVGQLLGDDPGGENTFDHLDFFEGLVAYIRTEGH